MIPDNEVRRRILPDDVLQAAKKTGLRLVAGMWGDGKTCGCPIVVLAAAAGVDMLEYTEIEFPVLQWAEAEFGKAYFHGFINGLDDGLRGGKPPFARSMGFVDGQAVAAAFPEAEEAQ